ncbi:ROK family protein [Paenibacillus cymbidii]|uniref:ROK family protein n=1 Tax=Paenibacillus cymbidii TaxID=1639034 RepID=UPI001F201BAB|nr:ROK family protein [Paenibacillus cymbidii]
MNAVTSRISGRKHKDVFELIRRQDHISKIELLEQSGLPSSTLTRILEELHGTGLLVEAGFGESTGGRRPILYGINPAYGYVFGLDISRFHSMMILCDMQMKKLDSRRWLMDERTTPDALVGEIVAAARGMLQQRNIPADQVIGMGIGAVGPLDRGTGTILDPQHFPAAGWRNVPIAAMLEERLGFPVALDNGANTAIIGEHWASRDREYRHLLYVHAGVGLRSAMMSGGKVVYGAVDMEGSIGQMIIQTDGPRLRDAGNFGSLETYASIYALERQARSRLLQGRDSTLAQLAEPDKITFPHLVQALHEGDPLVTELFTQAAVYFGIGLSNLLNILHPEKVILGGPLISCHPLMFETATKVALQNTYYHPVYQVVFSQGTLGEDALVTGAAAMMVGMMAE